MSPPRRKRKADMPLTPNSIKRAVHDAATEPLLRTIDTDKYQKLLSWKQGRLMVDVRKLLYKLDLRPTFYAPLPKRDRYGEPVWERVKEHSSIYLRNDKYGKYKPEFVQLNRSRCGSNQGGFCKTNLWI